MCSLVENRFLNISLKQINLQKRRVTNWLQFSSKIKESGKKIHSENPYFETNTNIGGDKMWHYKDGRHLKYY